MSPLLDRYREKIYSVLIYFIVFLSSVFPYGDKDWGWHYKYGEYFFTHGKLLTKDIFSWTLLGYNWINHSWGYDLLLFFLTKLTGFIGLSIIGGLINFLVFFLITSSFKLSYWKKSILALFFILMSEIGIMYGLRSQVISLLFFSLLMVLLIKIKKNINFGKLLPVLFFFWANLHGDFVIGIGIEILFLSSFLLINYFKNKKILKREFLNYLIISLLSFFVTLVNPYGINLYAEAFRHINNPYLRNVYEWQPILFNCSYCHAYTFGLYALIIFTFFYIRKEINDLPYFIFTIIFIYPTVETRRLLPIFLIVTLPFLAKVLESIKFDLDYFKSTKYIFGLIIIVGIQFNIFGRFNSFNLYSYSEDDYCYYASGCSVKVVNYIISHTPKGKGFNFYDWGGYLIGKEIKSKLFIDGRMHLWKKNNYMPFADYISMYYQDDFNKFTKYNFDWALVEKDSNIAFKLSQTKDLGLWKLAYTEGNSDYFVRLK